jgi:hypothetical protein
LRFDAILAHGIMQPNLYTTGSSNDGPRFPDSRRLLGVNCQYRRAWGEGQLADIVCPQTGRSSNVVMVSRLVNSKLARSLSNV